VNRDGLRPKGDLICTKGGIKLIYQGVIFCSCVFFKSLMMLSSLLGGELAAHLLPSIQSRQPKFESLDLITLEVARSKTGRDVIFRA
jgi:hypothetical protein